MIATLQATAAALFLSMGVAAAAVADAAIGGPNLLQPLPGLAPAIVGQWVNETAGTVVALDLTQGGDCELAISRLLGNNSRALCRYEHDVAGDSYGLYLVRENGLCDDNPDFYFTFQAEAPLISLNVGGSAILLRRP